MPAINGRVVCLTDGREYKVKDGLVFGRDAGSDVVVTGTEVSRVHAEICPQSDGYVLTDSSANGTFVNGTRITDPRPLARADVIRIGSDEFRFYADPRHVAEPQTAAAPGETTEATPDEGPAEPPPGASHRLFDTLHAMPVTDLTSAALSTRTAPLASLLIRSGSLKGNRIPVSLAAANIGRGDDNDVIIADPSVSATHARLERRETIWNLADRGSTNGTFVDGELVTEETPLGPGSTLRFGDVSVLFEPLDEEDERPGAVEGSVADEPANVRPRSIRAPRAQVPAAGGVPNWLIVLVLAVLAAIAFLLLT